MPLREFSRLTSRLFVHLGEEAVLRGEVVSPVRRINVEHGVELADANDQVIFNRSIATIKKEYLPVPGDSVQLVDGGFYFVLDSLFNDNGYSSRWILRGAVFVPPGYVEDGYVLEGYV